MKRQLTQCNDSQFDLEQMSDHASEDCATVDTSRRLVASRIAGDLRRNFYPRRNCRFSTLALRFS